MTSRAFVHLVVAALALASAASTVSCKRGANSGAGAADAEAISPDLVLKDESKGLLLTWVDDKGDFHVVESVTDVPMTGRDAVRVVDPARDQGDKTDDFVVADLRSARLDGTYPLRIMHRTDFENLAVARRQQNGPTLVSNGQPDGGALAGADGMGQAPNQPTGRPTVILYGASWCSACHQAEAYLKSKHVQYVEKDIEADPAAAAEMNGKLARFGLKGGSIPVLDVRGRVMVGFNPREVDAALGQKI